MFQTINSEIGLLNPTKHHQYVEGSYYVPSDFLNILVADSVNGKITALQNGSIWKLAVTVTD